MNKQHVQMNDFVREYQFLQRKLKKATDRVIKNGWYVLGEQVLRFEKRFAAYSGAKYCISVANGYDALYISLLSLDIKPGDEVIVPTHSFIATALPVSRVGATPVFVDSDEYYHMDPKEVEKAITKKTKAIIPVHLYGQMADMAWLKTIAEKHNLYLIEDACQAHGAHFKRKKAGTIGELGCFSFYPTKNLGAFGDGGAILTDSKELYEKCLRLRNYGQEVKYKHITFGINSRLDELQAAILNEKLTVLDSFIDRRKAIASIYTKQLANVPEVSLPKVRNRYSHVYHLFVIQAEDRDNLQAFLRESGIQTMIHYPIPIHKQEAYKEYNNLVFPKAEFASTSILSLPLHPFLTETEAQYVTDTIKRFYAIKKRKRTLSVGIPAFNEEQNIESVIRSVQLQQNKSYIVEKIIVVSDQSTDKTESIVENLAKKDKRIVLIRAKRRQGKCLTLNTIYRANKSELLLTVDADVILEKKDSIELLVRKLYEKKETLVVGGNLTPILNKKSFANKLFRANHLIWNQIRLRHNNGNNIYNLSGQASLIKGNFVKKVRYPAGISCDEYYLYLRAKKEHPQSFAFVENARVLAYPPTNFKDFRLAASRSLDERDVLINYFGGSSLDEFKIDPQVKLHGLVAALVLMNPLYLVAAIGLNLLSKLLPYHDSLILSGLWIPVASTKQKIRLRY